jgi:hypothetical protein
MGAVGAATLFDLATSVRAYLRSPDLVPVGEVRAAHELSALRAALAAEGIATKATGLATLSLLQAFAPYARAQILAHARDAERASALLHSWQAGESRPKLANRALPEGTPVGDLRKPPTAALAAIAALGTALCFFVSPRVATHRRSAPRAQLELVRVDDDPDPLRGMDEDRLPEGGALYRQRLPLPLGEMAAGDIGEARTYLHVSARDGESIEQAWARVRPWLENVALPPGDRWTWEEIREPIAEGHGRQSSMSWHIVGLRTVVLSGEPVVTTADVTDAEAVLDDSRTRASVNLTLTPAGAERFEAVTRTWLGRRLAIALKGHVDSAPIIRSVIRGGRVQISMGPGDADKQIAEARQLAADLLGEDAPPGPLR